MILSESKTKYCYTMYARQHNSKCSDLIYRMMLVQFQPCVPILRCDVIGNIVGFDPILLGSSPSTSAT